MRVLHLIDLRHDGVEPVLACRAAVRVPDAEHRVIGLGTWRDAARAESLGLTISDLVASPGGPAELSVRRLRRVIAGRTEPGATRPWAVVVQSWSVGALGLARLTFGGKSPARIGALLRSPRSSAFSPLRELRHKAALHDATLFCFDKFTRSAWADAASAIRGERYGEQNIRLLTAPLWNDPTDPTSRTDTRAKLGVKESDVLVALLADAPNRADAQRFTFQLGLMYTTGKRVVGIAPRGVFNAARAHRFVRMHGSNWGFVASPLPLTHLLRASDLGVWECVDSTRLHGGSSGSVTLALALSMGLPTVAARHEVSTAMLGGLAPELLARDETSNAIADRMLTLVGDAAARRTASEKLRLGMNQQGAGGSAAFEDELLRLWREAANVSVARTGLPLPPSLVGSIA